MDIKERNKNVFAYHKPTEDMIPKFKEIRQTAKGFADLLVESCPQSRELSTALTKLEECVMHANASIARSGDIDESQS